MSSICTARLAPRRSVESIWVAYQPALSLEPRHGFFQILGVEIQRVLWRIAMVDGANGQLGIHWEYGSLQRDLVADFPAIFVGQRHIDESAGAVLLPGLQLIRRNDLVGGNLQILVRIGGELGEEMFGRSSI